MAVYGFVCDHGRVFAIYQSADEEYAKSYPVPFSYFSYASDDRREAHLSLISSVLEEEGLEYRTVSLPFLELDGDARLKPAVISAEGYNRLASLLGREPLELQPGEAVEVSVWTNKADTRLAFREGETVRIGHREFRLVGVVQANIFPEGAFGCLHVISDPDFAELAAEVSALAEREGLLRLFGAGLERSRGAGRTNPHPN